MFGGKENNLLSFFAVVLDIVFHNTLILTFQYIICYFSMHFYLSPPSFLLWFTYLLFIFVSYVQS
jgi:hypothetical protein